MENNDVFELRLSRLPLFAFVCISSLFIFVGLDLAFLHILFPGFTVAPAKRTVFLVFEFFAVGICAVILFQMIQYLIKPPVFFRASSEGISFATGMRYTLTTFAWKYVDTVGGGIDVTSLVANKQLFGGLQITFKQDESIPGMSATAIGCKYIGYTLTLSWFYMNKSMKTTIEAIERLRAKYRNA